MIDVTLGDVRDLTSGRLVDGADEERRVTSVVVDSRRVGAGAVFVCLPGERVDGHDFAAAATGAGAVAVLAARPVGVPAVLVDDPQQALGALAAGVLRRAAGCRVVGVTGSSGKTSTKDLLAEVFAAAGPVVAPAGSFNNEIGLPLTVLDITAETRTLVLEYSARGVGHIRYLAGIARPDIAIVLNVGEAHLGEFGSREGIAAAKGELVEALDRTGTAVLNADDPLVAAMARRTTASVVTFGAGTSADVRVVDVTLDAVARPRFRLVTPTGETAVSLQVHGAHQATNAAAVAAAALAAGIDLATVVGRLEVARAVSPHRMAVTEREDGVTVVDDAYNANPASVRAALAAVTRLAAGRRIWLVLGEMRELGAESDDLHSAVGADAGALPGARVVAVGDGAAPLATGAEQAGARVARVDDAAAALALLRPLVAAGDVVLVKASNAERLWTVAEGLLADVPAVTGVRS